MAHQELALIALMKGIDKIPDKVWDLIPGHKEKKQEIKREVAHKEQEVESKQRRRRDSESSKYRGSRGSDKSDRSDEYDRDRGDRRRRAATDSPYSSDHGDDRDYRRERGRRSREYDERYSGEYDYKRRSGNYDQRPHSSYMPGAMPHPLYHPASLPGAPYGQPVPYAYAAVPPIQTQIPNGSYPPQIYAYPQSAGSSRSASNAPPMWSNDASRRSSMYSNNNYSPPKNVSPPMQPYAQPPAQAYQSHPAYTNGAPPSVAASRYVPSVRSQDPSTAAQSSAPGTSQQPSAYARPSPSPCPTCGHSPAPTPVSASATSPLNLPHPVPTHTLSFPFLQSTSPIARIPYHYSPPTQYPFTLPASAAATPVDLSVPTSRRSSISGGQPQGQRCESVVNGLPATTKGSNVPTPSLSRSSSVKAQVGRRPSNSSRNHHRRESATLNSVTERLEELAGEAADKTQGQKR